jgi:hypothetical protein
MRLVLCACAVHHLGQVAQSSVITKINTVAVAVAVAVAVVAATAAVLAVSSLRYG